MQIKVLGKLKEGATPRDIITEILRSREVEDKDILGHLPQLDELVKDLRLDGSKLEEVKHIITQAIKEKKNICVYGDYDADGITATAVMWLTLAKMGARSLPFIPSRTRHGYGLSKASVDEMLSGNGFGKTNQGFIPDLIITVDNGIVAQKEVNLIKAAGKQIIITDHHQVGDSLPNCDCLIHTTQTSGAGISWIVARYISADAAFASERIDLATIGIVADQMPVVGVNRGIIKEGLKKIAETNLLGLATILKNAGIFGKKITTYDINFVIGPRINAVGRIDDALSALRLLCTGNRNTAEELSIQMEELNKKRQLMTDTAIKDALTRLSDHKITVLASDAYHHGVIGLIAGKIAESTHKPAIVMSIDGDVIKGSARSVTGFDVTKLLRNHQGLLNSVGGHEQAAGFSLKKSNLDEFIEAITRDANENIDDKLLENTTIVDLELDLSSTNLELAEHILNLEPYGIGNIKPRFVSYNLNILSDHPMGEGGKHHKLTVESSGHTRTVLWFNGKKVDGVIKTLIYTLDINVWNNKKELQLLASYVEI